MDATTDKSTDAGCETPQLEFGSIATGARLLGDRWALMVVREMLCGARRFSEIHRGMPTLSRSMLAARLRNLERIGAVRRAPVTGTSRHEYLLTPAGESLREVLEAIGTWTETWHRPATDQLGVPDLLLGLQKSLVPAALPQSTVCIEFQFAHSSDPRGWLHAGPTHVRTCVDSVDTTPDLVVSTRPEVLEDLWHGRRGCEQTIASGDISFAGPSELVHGFRSWFRRADELTS